MSLTHEQIQWVARGLELFKDDHPISDSETKSKLVAALFWLIEAEGGDNAVVIELGEPANKRIIVVKDTILA